MSYQSNHTLQLQNGLTWRTLLTLAREGVDDFLLDTLLALRQALVLRYPSASPPYSMALLKHTFPTAMLG